MSNTSNTNGRAFEYICIITLGDVISKIRAVEIEESLKFDIKLIGMPSSVITINCKWV